MNIFILDNDVVRCARYHLDKHAIKMPLETTQLLNNALIQHDASYVPVYKQTHKNHPCSIWAGESLQNFEWLINLGLALCNEYTHRYGKEHKCKAIIRRFRYGYNNSNSMLKMPDVGMTPFRLCMPDEYKSDDAVESYRRYYMGEKAYIAKWSKREKPEWWVDNVEAG